MKKLGKLAKGIASVMAFVLAFTVIFSNGLTVQAATKSTEIFSGGTNESYESNDASWLMNADDSDVIKIVYTCTDDTHAGWGVLGWGATVDDNWKDGPGLSASETDATAKVTAKVTAGDLKKTLGIKDGSNVSYIKLGAWNGGKIESLSISGSGAESVASTDKATEEVVIQAPAELTGDYLYLVDEAKTITIWPGEYLQYWNPGTTIYLKIEMESNGSFGGCLGTCVNKWAWQMEQFSSDTGSTITVNWFLTPIMNNIQLQFWWMSGTQIGIKSIEVVKAIDYRVPVQAPDNDADDVINVDMADIAAASGNEVFTGSNSANPWGQAVTFYTALWGGDFDTAGLTANKYIVADYSSTTAPELILQDGSNWCKVNPCYAENGTAVFSYADMVASYGPDLSTVCAVHIGATNDAATVTSVRIVDAAQLSSGGPAPTAAPTEVPTAAPTEAPTAAPTEAPTAAPTEAPTAAPTEAPTAAPTEAPTAAPTEAPTAAPTEAPTAAPTEAPTAAPTEAPTEAPTATPAPTEAPVEYGTVWEGEQESGNWANAVQVSKDKFQNFKFDGTEKLVVTYKSTDTSSWGNTFKFAQNSEGWPAIKYDHYNTSIAAAETTEVVTLSSEYASLKDYDLIIQGNNWTISKVEVIGGVETIWEDTPVDISWSTTVAVDADKFAGLDFDGTEKLYITYTSTDPSVGYAQFKFVTATGWEIFGTNDSYNMAAVSIDAVEEVVLTADYAAAATDGFRIQGYNNTVSKIEIVK